MGWLSFRSAGQEEALKANVVKAETMRAPAVKTNILKAQPEIASQDTVPKKTTAPVKNSFAASTSVTSGVAGAKVNTDLIRAGSDMIDATMLHSGNQNFGHWSGEGTMNAIAPAVSTDPTEIFLRADITTQTMSDGREVVMWGFARDSSFGAEDGVVQVPGPPIEVQSENSSLVIHLDNNLAVPVSVVLTGHIENGGMTPVYMNNGRMRAFTHEAAPGNTVPEDYAWDVRTGTFFYHSGSHPQVQVHMGLYGAVTRMYDATHAYPDTPAVAGQVTLLFSEIDPELHDAVASGNYGPGTDTTSTINYAPQYFLINGESFSADEGFDPELPLGLAGEPKLLRLMNVGNFTHQPSLLGLRMVQIADDGNVTPVTHDRQTIRLQALKTVDAIVTPDQAGRYPVFDGRLFLAHGGMVRYLTAME